MWGETMREMLCIIAKEIRHVKWWVPFLVAVLWLAEIVISHKTQAFMPALVMWLPIL